MEVLRLGVESELWPLAYARATARWDPSRICYLHHNSQQRGILNPLSKARDQTCNRMVPSRICSPLRHNRNSQLYFNFLKIKEKIGVPIMLQWKQREQPKKWQKDKQKKNYS